MTERLHSGVPHACEGCGRGAPAACQLGSLTMTCSLRRGQKDGLSSVGSTGRPLGVETLHQMLSPTSVRKGQVLQFLTISIILVSLKCFRAHHAMARRCGVVRRPVPDFHNGKPEGNLSSARHPSEAVLCAWRMAAAELRFPPGMTLHAVVGTALSAFSP